MPNLGYPRLLWKLHESGKRGAIPSGGLVIRAALRLFRRDYNPSTEGSTAQAVAYLATSPAARALMADGDGRGGMGQLTQRVRGLLKPYADEPPPGLYRSTRPDLLIRMAGMAVPHFVSVVTRLGGDQELPDLPAAVNRLTMQVKDRRLVATDADVLQLALAAPEGTKLPEWHAGAHIDLLLPSGRTRQYSLCGDPLQERNIRSRCGGSPTAAAGLSKCMA